MSERPGRDPVLRWLRVLAIVAVLGLVILIVGVGVIANRPVDVPLVALLVGINSLWLGYEVFIPGLGAAKQPDDDEDEKAAGR